MGYTGIQMFPARTAAVVQASVGLPILNTGLKSTAIIVPVESHT